MKRRLRVLVGLTCAAQVLGAGSGSAQQVGDTAFRPSVSEPAFALGEGPRVVLDEAHANYHTLDGRYQTFARVLRADGFRVDGLAGPFTEAALADVDLLVIANALHPSNLGDWSLPTPSAFTAQEIVTVRDWVARGGALLLIADHMPFPGAAADLAAAFGFELSNGFAMDTLTPGPYVFRSSDGSLGDHAVVSGLGGSDRVDSVATFTGEAFRAPAGAVPLLTFREGVVSLMPETAWEFGPSTPSVDVEGWLHGAILEVGQGRLAVFGEAAMFSAQRQGAGGVRMGMNAPVASQNAQFLLNLVRWLCDA